MFSSEAVASIPTLVVQIDHAPAGNKSHASRVSLGGGPLTPAPDPERTQRFELLLTPHLGAAYNLARWLTRNDRDAEDLVQEAYLRAFRSFDGYRGGDPRAWMLKIVRNACYTWLGARRGDPVDERAADDPDEVEGEVEGPEAASIRRSDALLVRRALEALPTEFREIVVLRELEGSSYKEIAEIVGVPLGTVMSRLSRGRKQLLVLLQRQGGAQT